MNYKDLGFRPFYKNFSILLNNDNIMDIVADLDVDEAFDGVLVYGYVDHEAGFTFEILSLALQGDEGGAGEPASHAHGRGELRKPHGIYDALHSAEADLPLLTRRNI